MQSAFVRETAVRDKCAHATDRIQEKVCLEARGIALVAQPHWLQVSELDERTLV